jgi:DNA (cytosine-5)-methyltransferase 1
MTLGLQNAGFEVLCGVDSWNVASTTYALNFTHPALTADVSTMSGAELRREGGIGGQDIDLVVGGPPCQGFSVQRIGPDADTRNNLVLRFARMVLELKPRMFLMENVPGLLGKRGRELVEEYEGMMASAGYRVQATLVNAAAWGVPQTRRRVIYVGWRADVPAFSLPAAPFGEHNFATVLDAIGDLLPPPLDFTVPANDELHRRMRLSPLNQKRIEMIPPGGGMEDLPVDLRVDCHKKGADRIGHRYVYGRMSPDRPAPTITARFDSFTRGKFGHPVEPRNITLREGARLQSFPDSFKFKGTQEEIAALIGNAVPPTLAQRLATEIIRHLEGHSALRNDAPKVATRRRPQQLSLSISGEKGG